MGSSSPIFGENKKYLSCHHLENFISCDEHKFSTKCDPRCSMYGIFTYIWLKFMVNVGKYTLHGAFGDDSQLNTSTQNCYIQGAIRKLKGSGCPAPGKNRCSHRYLILHGWRVHHSWTPEPTKI